MESDHFKGLDVYEHLKAAREKGAKAVSETHGTEAPGHFIAATDSLKETAALLLGLYILITLFHLSSPLLFLTIFSIGWTFWKVGRSSLLGWSRLERLHRLIEEERWEIEHHRSQEKEELRAMYEQKGFSGPLLDEVVDVLMADDNRLLRVMLEEELGLTLESFEHPLKQAAGAAIGTVIAVTLGLASAFIGGFWGIASALLILFSMASLLAAKKEGNDLSKALIWNLAVGTVTTTIFYLISKAFL